MTLVVHRVQVGDRITAGDIYGVVFENSLVEHRIMLPPGARGNITYIAPAGHYNVEEEVIEVDFQGTKKVRGCTSRTRPSSGSGGLAVRRGLLEGCALSGQKTGALL